MLVPMDKVVRDACRTMGDSSYSKYMEVVQHANEAYRDLCLYVIPEISELTIKTELLTSNEINAVRLPEDFVYETKVGICRGKHIAVLAVNEDMCTSGIDVDDHCGCTEEESQQVEDALCGCTTGLYGYTFYNGNLNGQFGEFYGMGLGYNVNGYYKIDKKQNILYLDASLPKDTKLIIEYKSNGVGCGADLIPTEAEKCIKEYIYEQMYRFSDKAASRIAQENYQNEYNKMKRLYLTYTKEQWHDVLLKNNKPTVKS